MSSDPARARLLEAAVQVFLRFGYRKTSMEEVARAAHISRQGLYLHFATKEALFVATVTHLVEGAEESARTALEDGTAPISERVARAFDALVGRFVGTLGADTADLVEASSALVGDCFREHEQRACEIVAKALRTAGLGAAYKPVGVSARQLAETLYATARGYKYTCATRDEFKERMQVAARALCLPLGRAAC
ncbi:MAG: hypothetical protein RL385_2063 [Pseudomonadota bacterium]